MLRIAIVLTGMCVLGVQALAASSSSSAEHGLLRMEPKTMMMQVCDIKMVQDLTHDKRYHADFAMVDAMKRPLIENDTIQGEGGAFRSKGHWFQFGFSCTLTPDHLKTVSLTYQVGGEIPQGQWEKFGLWP